MTPGRIKELRAVIAKATPGPWFAGDANNGEIAGVFYANRKKAVGYCVDDDSDNATAIVQSVNAIPSCLDTIEAQAARIVELEAALEPFADVAAHDISDDEADEDIFRPMSTQKIAVAPLLTVGHLRAARAALTKGE